MLLFYLIECVKYPYLLAVLILQFRECTSIFHYLIDFIKFILYNQDLKEPNAVLAAMIDFSKAFNRQNHHILITKLGDMGDPGWLLQTVIGFLIDRELIVW